jgi:hypothetical protein
MKRSKKDGGVPQSECRIRNVTDVTALVGVGVGVGVRVGVAVWVSVGVGLPVTVGVAV